RLSVNWSAGSPPVHTIHRIAPAMRRTASSSSPAVYSWPLSNSVSHTTPDAAHACLAEHPENRTNTLGSPALAPSPCRVRKISVTRIATLRRAGFPDRNGHQVGQDRLELREQPPRDRLRRRIGQPCRLVQVVVIQVLF